MTNQTNFSSSRRDFLKGAASASVLSVGGLSSLAFAVNGTAAIETSPTSNVLNGNGIRVIQETLFNKEKVTLINESGKLQMLDVRQPIALHQANGTLVVTVNQDAETASNGMMVMSPGQQLSFDVKAMGIEITQDLGLPALTNLAENQLQISSSHSVFNRVVPVQLA